MSVSKIYSIQDYYKSYLTSYFSQSVVNLDLPTDYEIEFTLFSNNSTINGNTGYMRFDSSSDGYVGKGSSNSRNIGIVSTFLPNPIPVSKDTTYIFKKENNVLSLTDGTDTITESNSNYTKLYSINGSTGGQIKNIKITKL